MSGKRGQERFKGGVGERHVEKERDKMEVEKEAGS